VSILAVFGGGVKVLCPINYGKSEYEKYKNCEYHYTYACPDYPGFHRFVLRIMRHIINLE
jgi:hypothetical protein